MFPKWLLLIGVILLTSTIEVNIKIMQIQIEQFKKVTKLQHVKVWLLLAIIFQTLAAIAFLLVYAFGLAFVAGRAEGMFLAGVAILVNGVAKRLSAEAWYKVYSSKDPTE